MDIITGLPQKKKLNDSIFIVIDKLSKVAHFIPVKLTYKAMNIVDIFLKEIFILHGIPKSWEDINMDFITGLSKRKKQNYSIFIVIDKMSKVAHFIPMKSTYKAVNIADIFLKEIFRLHGIPKVIISYQDVKFTRKFWRSLFSVLDMQLNFSTAYHLQKEGKTKRVNQIVEYML